MPLSLIKGAYLILLFLSTFSVFWLVFLKIFSLIASMLCHLIVLSAMLASKVFCCVPFRQQLWS